MRPAPPESCGFSLVEVTLSLAIATFCLISIFALLPVGLASNKDAVEQTAVMNVLTGIATDLRTAQSSTSTTIVSSRYGISLPPANYTSSTPVPVATSVSYITADGQPCLSGSSDPNAKYQVRTWATAPSAFSVNGAFVPFPAPGHFNQTITAPKNTTQVRLLLTWPAQANYLSPIGSAESVISLDRN
ncbi:MAG: hypothetical protein WCH43_02660 [Verrucomicrobiota bacterium]